MGGAPNNPGKIRALRSNIGQDPNRPEGGRTIMADICSVCGLPKELCMCEEIAREQQSVRIYTDSRRYGKIVTVSMGSMPQT